MVEGGREKQNKFSQITKKKHSSQNLAVKTTCFTQYLSYLNPKGEDSSYNIDGFPATYTSKLKWAWQHPPNFENLYNF